MKTNDQQVKLFTSIFEIYFWGQGDVKLQDGTFKLWKAKSTSLMPSQMA